MAGSFRKLRRQVDGNRRGADTAAHTGYGDDAPTACRRGNTPGQYRQKAACDDVTRERLGKVFLYTQIANDLAIEFHILDVADDKHTHARLDIKSEVFQSAEWILLA